MHASIQSSLNELVDIKVATKTATNASVDDEGNIALCSIGSCATSNYPFAPIY